MIQGTLTANNAGGYVFKLRNKRTKGPDERLSWYFGREYKYTYLKVQMNNWAFRFTGESYIY